MKQFFKELFCKHNYQDTRIKQVEVINGQLNYCGKDRKWNPKTDIYADGFMTGWNLAFARIPYKPESEEQKEMFAKISEAASLLKIGPPIKTSKT